MESNRDKNKLISELQDQMENVQTQLKRASKQQVSTASFKEKVEVTLTNTRMELSYPQEALKNQRELLDAKARVEKLELMVNALRESMNYWRSRSTNVEQSSQDENHTNAVPDSCILIEIPFDSTIEDLIFNGFPIVRGGIILGSHGFDYS